MSPPYSFAVDPAALSRFLAKVAPANENGCELWTASVDHNGYGQFYLKVEGVRRVVKAHLVSLSIALEGQFPSGLEPDHVCVTPRCTSIAHIEWVTPVENRRRVFSRMTHCRAGLHLWIPENWRMLKNGPTCRQCANAAQNSRYHTTKKLVGRYGLPKLSESDVVAIRRSALTTSHAELARAYGVAPGTIRAVVERRTWKNVQSVP